MSDTDFASSFILVYTPSCNKDIDSIKLFGFWKTLAGARKALRELVNVEKKLKKYLRKDFQTEVYSFEGLIENEDYKKLLDVELCCPSCNGNPHTFWIQKVQSQKEFSDFMDMLKDSIW